MNHWIGGKKPDVSCRFSLKSPATTFSPSEQHHHFVRELVPFLSQIMCSAIHILYIYYTYILQILYIYYTYIYIHILYIYYTYIIHILYIYCTYIVHIYIYVYTYIFFIDIIRVNYNDLTDLPNPGIMVYVKEIIPFNGRTSQVSELL